MLLAILTMYDINKKHTNYVSLVFKIKHTYDGMGEYVHSPRTAGLGIIKIQR